jgi:phosphoribosylformylglycinamidine synthase
VVKGIGHYGNCFGVPTVVAKFILKNVIYQSLVNAMSVGYVKWVKTISATARALVILCSS